MDAPRLNPSISSYPLESYRKNLSEENLKIIDAAKNAISSLQQNISTEEQSISDAENKDVTKALDNVELDFQSMLEIINKIRKPQDRTLAISKIIRNLLVTGNNRDLVVFISQFPENARDGHLFEAVSFIIKEAKTRIDKFCETSLQHNYIETYEKIRPTLLNAILLSFIAYSLIEGIQTKFALIKGLLISIVHFPEIPIRSFPYIFKGSGISEFCLEDSHNKLLEFTRKKYQSYVSEKTKDLFNGKDGRVITYYEFLKFEEQDPANPSAHAASMCRKMLERYADSRKAYQRQLEESVQAIHDFQKQTAESLREAVIKAFFVFHFKKNDFNTLICLLPLLCEGEFLPKALLAAADMAQDLQNLAAFRAFFHEIIRYRDRFSSTDRQAIEQVLLKGANLALNNNDLPFANEIFRCIP